MCFGYVVQLVEVPMVRGSQIIVFYLFSFLASLKEKPKKYSNAEGWKLMPIDATRIDGTSMWRTTKVNGQRFINKFRNLSKFSVLIKKYVHWSRLRRKAKQDTCLNFWIVRKRTDALEKIVSSENRPRKKNERTRRSRWADRNHMCATRMRFRWDENPPNWVNTRNGTSRRKPKQLLAITALHEWIIRVN